MSQPEHTFPESWASLGIDYTPKDHLMQIKGKDYFTVQNRLIWFVRDQRALIIAGHAKMPYALQCDLIELDRQGGWAHFRATVRDVLGNEAVMYGSESVKDFPDFIEKASTKALGRALLLLGYGTAFTDEMIDEGERVVDAPVQRSQPQPNRPTPPARPAAPTPIRQAQGTVQTTGDAMATDRQISSIRKLCAALGRPEPEVATLTFAAARELLTSLSQAYSEARQVKEA